MTRLPLALLAAALLTSCHSAGFTPLPFSVASIARSCHAVDGRADAHCTPGATNPDVTQDTIRSTICVPGWTKTVRPSTAYTNLLKTSQMRDYNLSGPPSDYEEDHLIPLAAGGAPRDPKNLWPEPWNGSTGAHRKDVDEVRTQHDICAGLITLTEGQRRIFEKWTH